MIHEKSYVCFTCLNESTDPKICTYCGEKIEEADMNAEILPPTIGEICIDLNNNNDMKLFIMSAIEEQKKDFFDNFDIREISNIIIIGCNDIAADRLISKLNKNFKYLSEDSRLVFERKPLPR